MSGELLIGVDAGTSVIKAVAFDLAGHQVAIASRRNTYSSLPNGGVEQDMARTWADTAGVLIDLGEKVENLATRAVALGVTGQGDGTWLIDGEGEPVHDAWLWLDARAVAEAREIAASDGIHTIYETCGTGVNVCQMRSHLTWMVRHAPELLTRATTAFHCKDWLYYKMTGERATDPTEGVFTFGDFRKRDYSDEVIAALGLKAHRHLMPPIVDGAAVTHAMSSVAADETGLREGLPVSLGYVDIMCCALAAGLHDPVTRPGLSVLGSTGMHMRFVPDADSVVLNADLCGYTMAFPGKAYAQMQTNMAATLNIDWMLGLALEVLESQGHGMTSADLLAQMDDRVMAARAGAAIYHPYISTAGERGPFAEPDARASFIGLDQNTGWFDMMRAVYDGLALAARDCFDAMGPLPGQIRITGGAARSKALTRLMAGALNAPLRRIDQEEAGAAGAVMMAGIASGVFANVDAATDAWVTPRLTSVEAPDPALVETAETLYAAYRAGRKAAPPVWDALSVLRQGLA